MKKSTKMSSAIFITTLLIMSMFTFVFMTIADESETIRINEIMYNPAGADSGHEWIEVYNTEEDIINIEGWKFFEQGTNHTLSLTQGTWDIPARGFAVIADNANNFLTDYPGYVGILFDSAFSLVNSGEYIALRNDIGDIVDEVNYIPQDGANNTGMSLEYKINDIWEVSLTYEGTPGAINSVAPPMKITKAIWNGEEWVENITATVGDIIRFNITIMHTGPAECPLKNFTIKDILPDILTYHDNATFNNIPREPDVIEDHTITWNISHSEFSLPQGENAYLEFDAIGTAASTDINIGNVTAQYGYPELHDVYGEDNVTVTILEGENNPPYEPSNPNPEDGATGVDIDSDLSWTGGDPDPEDTVTYDVYFGTSSPPPKVESNQSENTYNPGTMSYATTYYWQIIAWDNHNASTPGLQWEFTTVSPPTNNITVNITKPVENYFYLRDNPVLPLRNRTFIYGAITIEVNATADAGIDRVELYVDGNLLDTSNETPYSFHWAPIISFQHTITAVAFDTAGNNASDEIEVWKWRVHPLLIMAGTALILKSRPGYINEGLLKGWTIIRGYVFNLRHRGNELVFRALRLHYTKITPLGIETGVLKLQKCVISDIGPDTHIDYGPLGSFSWIFGVCRGGFRTPHLKLT